MPLFLPLEKAKETLIKLALSAGNWSLTRESKAKQKTLKQYRFEKKEIELKEKSSINWM